MQGLIQPLIPSGSEAAVFAVYNDRKQLQYVGFSKDLYNSLRTLLGRRPDKAFFYKYVPEFQDPLYGATWVMHACCLSYIWQLAI